MAGRLATSVALVLVLALYTVAQPCSADDKIKFTFYDHLKTDFTVGGVLGPQGQPTRGTTYTFNNLLTAGVAENSTSLGFSTGFQVQLVAPGPGVPVGSAMPMFVFVLTAGQYKGTLSIHSYDIEDLSIPFQVSPVTGGTGDFLFTIGYANITVLSFQPGNSLHKVDINLKKFDF